MVITDGLDMKGITNTYANGAGELAALQAGNDILLLPPDVEKAIAAIKGAAVKDENLRQQINYHCRRVLEAKYRLVVPTLNDPITVPGDDRRKACEEIVADLNLALDRRIDSIVDAAIAARAMPGCQIVVLHKGRTIIDRTYGYLTYDADADTVTTATVYDLASLTKVCATTLAVMKLVDMGKLKIDDKLSKYLPYLKGTDKENITIKQAMSHCARLKAFDAYWQQASDYDSILRLVAATPLKLDKEGYGLQRLGLHALSDVVRVSAASLSTSLSRAFLPAHGPQIHGSIPSRSNRLTSARIAPTEADSLRGLIRGTVHDPNAYAMGGVSGHAGLFSTAEELAQIMQMLLDGGVYKGRRYLKAEDHRHLHQPPFRQTRQPPRPGLRQAALQPLQEWAGLPRGLAELLRPHRLHRHHGMGRSRLRPRLCLPLQPCPSHGNPQPAGPYECTHRNPEHPLPIP